MECQIYCHIQISSDLLKDNSFKQEETKPDSGCIKVVLSLLGDAGALKTSLLADPKSKIIREAFSNNTKNKKTHKVNCGFLKKQS